MKAFNLYLNKSICLLERFSWHLLQKMLVKSLLSGLARWGIKVILNQKETQNSSFRTGHRALSTGTVARGGDTLVVHRYLVL